MELMHLKQIKITCYDMDVEVISSQDGFFILKTWE
jgi:hypothetical protein